ncbi:MAG TPA: carotenoid oxygenase, partial [Franconibacter pulveris]|nr:carotenoid oxygenase [Franconibacter pulveris]
ERFTGQPYRHGWFVTTQPEDGEMPERFNTLAHIDHHRNHVATWQWPEAVSVSEPVFVPASDTAAEGEGALLMTVWSAISNTSALVAFDALNIEQGPLWRAALPVRVPDGFHGNWFADGEDA